MPDVRLIAAGKDVSAKAFFSSPAFRAQTRRLKAQARSRAFKTSL
jgi:hypothetical protein